MRNYEDVGQRETGDCHEWHPTDVRLTRPFKLKNELVTIEPAIEWFNVFNVANYDLPGNTHGPALNAQPGSINGTTATYRPNRAGFDSGSFALGIPLRRRQE